MNSKLAAIIENIVNSSSLNLYSFTNAFIKFTKTPINNKFFLENFSTVNYTLKYGRKVKQ